MGEWSGFFPSHNGDRKYTTADTAATTDILFHSGVCQQGDLTLTPAGGMTAQLGEGWAIVNGYHYKNDGPLVLTFGYADGALDRIDTVVVRRDVNTRDIHAMVVAGTPAITPVAPAYIRDAETYDLCLYYVRVPAGATAITSSMITDKRADSDLCGYVYCKFKGIDLTVMQKQYETWFSELSDTALADQEAFESEFVKWFAHMKDQLTEDAAGNLQLQIDKQQEQIDAILREDVRKEGFVGHCYNGFTHCQPT